MDPQNDLYDQRLARHMISLYFSTGAREESDILVQRHNFKNYPQLQSSLIQCMWVYIKIFYFIVGNGSTERLHCLREGKGSPKVI